MAVITTVLTEYSSGNDSVVYALPGHTVSKPKLVIQKRKPLTGNKVVAESHTTLMTAAVNAAGDVLPARLAIDTTCRLPAGTVEADVDALITLHREQVASDEFARFFKAQLWFGS